MFRELQLIEKWGSGIQRIIRLCEEAGLSPPHFTEIANRFRITFYMNKVAPVQLDKDELLIIDLLKKHESLSTHALATAINLSKKTVRARLIKLIEKGQVKEIAKSMNEPQKKYLYTGTET